MPAKSKAQQRFMGMVHSYKKEGGKASPAVKKAAKGISKKAAKDFAGTKHKGLPNNTKKKVAEGIDILTETFKKALYEIAEGVIPGSRMIKEDNGFIAGERVRHKEQGRIGTVRGYEEDETAVEFDDEPGEIYFVPNLDLELAKDQMDEAGYPDDFKGTYADKDVDFNVFDEVEDYIKNYMETDGSVKANIEDIIDDRTSPKDKQSLKEAIINNITTTIDHRLSDEYNIALDKQELEELASEFVGEFIERHIDSMRGVNVGEGTEELKEGTWAVPEDMLYRLITDWNSDYYINYDKTDESTELTRLKELSGMKKA